MGSGVIFCVIVLVFTAPAWWAILLGRPMSWTSLLPVLPLTISSLIQVTFILTCGEQHSADRLLS
jgi:hypothetical protein